MRPATAAAPIVDGPGPGARVQRGRRRVRLADAGPTGRLRLDSLARFLQDVAADDVREAGVAGEVAWVVRRTTIEVSRWPRYDEVVDLVTWCSGVGAAWAERRTSIHADRLRPEAPHPEAPRSEAPRPDGLRSETLRSEALRPQGAGGAGLVEIASIWVSLDPLTMRPVPPGDRFAAVWGRAAGDRRVRATLSLPGPDTGAASRPWALRQSDVDLLGHVNNAIALAAVDDEVTRVAPDATIASAEVEYRAAIDVTMSVTVRSQVRPGEVLVWLSDDRRDLSLIRARVRIGDRGQR